MAHGARLGLDIKVDTDLASVRKVRRKRPFNPQDTPGPKYVCAMELAACEDFTRLEGDEPSPACVYMRNAFVAIVGGDRPGEAYKAKFTAADKVPPEGDLSHFRIVVSEDKEGREDVVHYVPFGGLYNEVLPWQDQHAQDMCAIGMHDPEFMYERGLSKLPLVAKGWASKAAWSAKPKECPLKEATVKCKQTALESATSLLAHATGITAVELQKRKLAGRQIFRHVPPHVGTLLSTAACIEGPAHIGGHALR
jgi:hypothetical protein